MGCCLSSPPHIDLDDEKNPGQTLHRPKWNSEGTTREQLEVRVNFLRRVAELLTVPVLVSTPCTVCVLSRHHRLVGGL